MLRNKIEKLILSVQDKSDAAMKICRRLDEDLSLSGNGWFDDDAVLGDADDTDEDCLRLSISRIIDSEDDHTEAAIKICLLLEDRICLAGNGWFDDDEIMEARLSR